MNVVKVRNLEIGSGLPKICVPIVGKSEEEILESAQKMVLHELDLVEWRADWFEGLLDEKRVIDLLAELRAILGEIPLLFTIRTKTEGGEVEIMPEVYSKINQRVALSGYVDMVDVEVFQETAIVKSLVDDLQKADVKVIGSNHEFLKTPEKEELIRRLCFMQECGVDIMKIAVMPVEPQDVLVLLAATEEMVRNYAKQPVVTMSMGHLGVISRISGGVFGSSITFGSVGKISAPGQLDIETLKNVLEILN